jgi:hypothetical protein
MDDNEKIAQPPDAKPVAWIDPSKQQAFITEEFRGVLRTWANARVVKPDIDLYDVPQPPAGKGVVQAKCSECGKQSTPDSMWALYCLDCCESLRAHSATDAVRAEPMQRQPIQDSSVSGAASIPREIHERLVRDAKREALREAAERMHMDGFYGPAEWLRSRAAEHERENMTLVRVTWPFPGKA